MMRQLLLLVLICMSGPVRAEPTLAVWFDYGELTRRFTPPVGAPFELVVTLDSAESSVRYAEWSMPNLRELFPGVFLLGVSTPGDFNCGLGGCLLGPGDFSIPFDACEDPGERIELARVMYGDFGNFIHVGAEGLMITLGVLSPGADFPPQFADSPGFRDCQGLGHAARMGGSPEFDAMCNYVIIPAGASWLSPGACVAAAADSFGTLKSRY
ncbi:hypothetical protein DRQ53_07710 [bacterium]|nr:MAG: hypothetical protein DRQ53_07710 [bacterium]